MFNRMKRVSFRNLQNTQKKKNSDRLLDNILYLEVDPTSLISHQSKNIESG